MNKMPYIRSLRDVRGASQAKLYSIPKQQRSVHLDLYVVAREKERLEKELFQIQMKSRLVKKRLAQSNKRMNDLIREVSQLHQGGGTPGKHGKGVEALIKKMRMDY